MSILLPVLVFLTLAAFVGFASVKKGVIFPRLTDRAYVGAMFAVWAGLVVIGGVIYNESAFWGYFWFAMLFGFFGFVWYLKAK